MQIIESFLRIITGVIFLGITVLFMILCLCFLIPWRVTRIKFTNVMGTVIGSGIMWISGSKVTVSGLQEARSAAPALYVGNHTSIMDAFTSIWVTPIGTVGLAKKEIIFYPFYGIAWILSGHPTVDRGKSVKAQHSVNQMGEFVKKNRLSICMWPEGTRSKDGRLLKFKKGVVHLAIQTGLPIIPMVTTGATNIWGKGQFVIKKNDIRIRFLPQIDTSHWTTENIELHLSEIHKAISDSLPAEMKPISETQPYPTEEQSEYSAPQEHLERRIA